MAKLFERKDYRAIYGDDLLDDDDNNLLEESVDEDIEETVEDDMEDDISTSEADAQGEILTDETIIMKDLFDIIHREEQKIAESANSQVLNLDEIALVPIYENEADEIDEVDHMEAMEQVEEPVFMYESSEDDEEDEEESGFATMLHNIFEGGILDKVVIGIGIAIAICILCVCTTMLFGGESEVSQATNFNQVGVNLKDIEVIGQEGLLAMAGSMQDDAPEELPDTDYEEEDLSSSVRVNLEFTSIQRDLKVKFVNQGTGKLVANVPFEISVKDSNGDVTTWIDDDMDGIIYKKDIDSGMYTIQMVELEGNQYSKYLISTTTDYKAEVKKDIAYEKVDVEDEIKDQSEVDAEKEEIKNELEDVESENKDTVVWVESTKTYIGDTYSEISKSDIVTTTASIVNEFFLRTADSSSGGTIPEPTFDKISVSLPGNATLDSGKEMLIQASATGTQGEALSYSWSYGGATSEFTIVENGSSVTVTPKTNTSSANLEITVTVSYTNESADTTTTSTATTTVTGNAISYGDLVIAMSDTTIKVGETGTIVATVTADSGKNLVYEWSSGNEFFTVTAKDTSATVTASEGAGAKTMSLTLKVYYSDNPEKSASKSITITGEALAEVALKTSEGTAVYVLDGETYRVATTSDYDTYSKFYTQNTGYKYTGWQTIDGKVYYYDANGKYVTGQQVILGAVYTFNSDGSMQSGTGTLGIDVSRYNTVLDWNAVKNAGVNFVIVRTGYRGYGTGVLVEDSSFKSHISGAKAAGLDVGVYFFSQAIDEREAVEEASMVIQQVQGYGLTYPIYIDVEYSNSSHTGRADGLSVAQRTAVVSAFCKTIQNSGYRAGIYANKSWLETMIDMSQLGGYSVWLAQYATTPTYSGHYDMWQYSQTGTISGVSGNVDLNLSY